MSSHAEPRQQPLDPAVTLPAVRVRALLPFVLGIGLAAATLVAKGGGELKAATKVDIWVTLIGAGLVVVALLFAPTPQRRWGGVTLVLLAGLAAWTAATIAWSINPADSWAEANRTVAYVAAFAGAIAIARLAPERARVILIAVLVGCLTVLVIALYRKAFPAAANSTAVLARLREPLDYWNALGLLAAMAVPACVWLGARRDGAPGVRALAHPLLGLTLVALVFSFSRGSIMAAVIGLAFWFAFVPLRLRGLMVLLPSVATTAAISAWSFSQTALSKDRISLHARTIAGHKLALLLLLMLILLFAVGVLVEHLGQRHPLSPTTRRRLGVAALCVAALIPLAGIGALATSERGLWGSVSSAWNSFFATSSTSPQSYGPDRLTSTGSKRGAYWGEAYKIWSQNKIEGAGAGGYATARLRYRHDQVEVRHAHGFVPQTAADLGLVGLILSLGALVAWIGAAWRATRRPPAAGEEPTSELAAVRPGGRTWGTRVSGLSPARLPAHARDVYARSGTATAFSPLQSARIEMLTVVTVVLIFGIHSALDWTWAFTGTALVALVCAGYVAGHGPPGAAAAQRSAPIQGRIAAAVAVALIALAAAWTIWQPARSQAADEASAELLTNDRIADSLLLVQQAIDRNPVSVEPLFQLAQVQAAGNHPVAGRNTLLRAVRMQPENPDTWRELASYETNVMHSPSNAYKYLREALARDPRNPILRREFVGTNKQLPRSTHGGGKTSAKKSGPTGASEVTKCRALIRKTEAQLKSGTVPAAKAAKKRAKLARCKSLVSHSG